MKKEEIKLRRLANQHLISPVEKLTVVRDLCGAQAQFFSNAVHSLKIRTRDFDENLFSESLVKNWTLRGTVHVFAEDDLPLFVRANGGKDYLLNEWNGYTFWNKRDCWALTPERQKYLSEIIVFSVSEGAKTREELKAICREHGMTEAEEGSMFDQWGGGVRELCERGFMHYCAEEKKAFCLTPKYTPVPEEEARLELARRYFTNFGPASVHDAMYFFGAKKSEVTAWLSALPVKSTECDGVTYYYIENEISYNCDIPNCVFLAGFDQLMLGYQKKESLFLPQEHIRGIFNLAGIVMPAVLLHGNVVGKWKKKGKKLQIEIFSHLGVENEKTITDAAEAMWNDIGKIEITEI